MSAHVYSNMHTKMSDRRGTMPNEMYSDYVARFNNEISSERHEDRLDVFKRYGATLPSLKDVRVFDSETGERDYSYNIDDDVDMRSANTQLEWLSDNRMVLRGTMNASLYQQLIIRFRAPMTDDQYVEYAQLFFQHRAVLPHRFYLSWDKSPSIDIIAKPKIVAPCTDTTPIIEPISPIINSTIPSNITPNTVTPVVPINIAPITPITIAPVTPRVVTPIAPIIIAPTNTDLAIQTKYDRLMSMKRHSNYEDIIHFMSNHVCDTNETTTAILYEAFVKLTSSTKSIKVMTRQLGLANWFETDAYIIYKDRKRPTREDGSQGSASQVIINSRYVKPKPVAPVIDTKKSEAPKSSVSRVHYARRNGTQPK